MLITTPHSSHAALTARALEAGKNVLVEKPLALDREQLNTVIRARLKSNAFLQVGFNRRFAPLSVKARGRLESAGGTKYVLLRVNAGQLPEESWQNVAEEGNGRILGEVCHFVDLARFLVGDEIKTVQAAAASVTVISGNPRSALQPSSRSCPRHQFGFDTRCQAQFGR